VKYDVVNWETEKLVAAREYLLAEGVDEYRHLLILFGVSAFIAGIMGAFYAH